MDTAIVTIYVRDQAGARIKWTDQEGASKAVARGKVFAAKAGGMPPVYAETEDGAIDKARRAAKRSMALAKIGGATPHVQSFALGRTTETRPALVAEEPEDHTCTNCGAEPDAGCNCHTGRFIP
jgi:hypothetical protein